MNWLLRLFPMPDTICCKPRDRLRQNSRETRRDFLSVSVLNGHLRFGFI